MIYLRCGNGVHTIIMNYEFQSATQHFESPVKSKENVTEQGWMVQMKMLRKICPPPFAEYQRH